MNPQHYKCPEGHHVKVEGENADPHEDVILRMWCVEHDTWMEPVPEVTESAGEVYKLFDASDSKRLARARLELKEVLESGRLESYPKGQLGLAAQVVTKCENILKEREDV